MVDVSSHQEAAAYDYNMAVPGGLDDENFLPGLNKMREVGPVVWSDFQRGWMVLGHKEVYEGFHDKRLSSIRLQVENLSSIPDDQREALIPNILQYVPNWIINIDAPQHTRIRKLMLKAFSKKVVKSLLPFVGETVEELISDIKARNGEVEWVKQVAFELPARTIMRVLGIPAEYRALVLEITPKIIVAFQTPVPTREILLDCENALVQLNELCLSEINKRRVEPQDDLLTVLVQASEEGDKLSEAELLAACQIILTAGYDTTANSNVMGMIALEKNPEQKAYFLQRPDEMVNNLQELFRYIGMSSIQPRFAIEDVELGGQTIKKGDLAMLCIAAANRDPNVFANPESLDFSRDASDVMTFGPGIHHCLGHLLAREQVALFYRRFYEEFDRVEILEDKPEFSITFVFRGLQRLNVKCHLK